MTRRKQGEGTDLGVEATPEGREAALRTIVRDLHWMARNPHQNIHFMLYFL